MRNGNRKLLITSAVVLALSAGGVGIAQAVDGDSEAQVTGPQAERAERAALEAVGGGTVVSVERDDQAAGWEVEVVKRDSRLQPWGHETTTGKRRVEVRLNRDFEWIEATTVGYGPESEGDDRTD